MVSTKNPETYQKYLITQYLQLLKNSDTEKPNKLTIPTCIGKETTQLVRMFKKIDGNIKILV